MNDKAVSYLDDATNRLARVGDEAWRNLRSIIQSGVEAGESGETIKGRLEQVTQWSEYRADTVARTETVGAYVRGDLAGAEALGDNGPIEKVWVAAIDARTRDSHRRANDQVVPFAGMFTVGGHSMDAPHDRSAPAGEIVNCRCYVEFLYPGDARPDGTLAGTDTEAEKIDWSTMSTDEIREALGRKYDAEIAVDRWATSDAQMLATTYDDLATRYPISDSLRPRTIGDIDEVFGRPLSRDMGGAVSAIDVRLDGTIKISGGRMGFGVRRSWMKPTGRSVQAHESGWLAASGPDAAITHEFGHLVGYQARQQAVMRGVDLVDEFTKAVGHVESKYPAFGDAWTQLRGKARTNLSKYGASSVDELMAESFAEFEIAGENCRPFARAIVETMLRLQP